MSAQNTDASMSGGDATLDKGKGKAAEPTREDVNMAEEDSSDEESGPEEQGPEPEEVDEDNMEEIDPENIIQDGRRTRGKAIDFTKANQEAGPEDYDEDDDEDFEDPDESMQQ